MPETTQAAGAMPVVRCAMRRQSYPFGPGWAPYRLPIPGTNAIGPREAGVGFDGEPGDGANPPAIGAPPATPPAAPATQPATGDPDALGDAGKRALEQERAARRAAEAAAKAAQDELEKLKSASQTEAEKALAQARKEGGAEVLARVQAQVRRSEVKAALVAAGINGTVLDLAAKADEFEALKVTDDGVVEGLAEAVKAFKDAKPDLFKAPQAPGTADGGARGTGKTVTREQLKKMTPEEINAAYERGELAPLLGGK